MGENVQYARFDISNTVIHNLNQLSLITTNSADEGYTI